MTRRPFLLSLLGGLWALVSCRTPSPPTAPPLPSAPNPRFARNLRRDFRRNRARTYSEEGVPMFLVGENLAPTPTLTASPARDPLAERLAAEIRRSAPVLAEARLATAESDLGQLLEVLAERDFGNLRNGPTP